jgi:integrase
VSQPVDPGDLVGLAHLASRALQRLLIAQSRAGGLGLLEFLVLARAAEGEGVTPGEARRSLGLRTSTMAGLCDRLEAALAEDTRRRYLEVWGTHLLPPLGDYELRAITPWLVEDFRADLERAKVGAPTVRKAMMLVQGMLRRAVVRGLIASNPVQSVGKPRQAPAQPPGPLAPEVVERIRAQMMTAWSSPSRGAGRSPEQLAWWRARNATIVSLLAYGGLRPSEDRARAGPTFGVGPCTW